jgi:hypothetical protein
MREKYMVSRSSCESEIYATDEGTKSVLSHRHFLQHLDQPDGFTPTPVWNDNRSCVDWTHGVAVSKKLRHLNMRELGVRLSQKLGEVDIRHIEGKSNPPDIFTQEIKGVPHYRQLASLVTSPRSLSKTMAAAAAA